VILGWLAVYDDAKTERAAGIGRKERGFKRIYVISEATATTPWNHRTAV